MPSSLDLIRGRRRKPEVDTMADRISAPENRQVQRRLIPAFQAEPKRRLTVEELAEIALILLLIAISLWASDSGRRRWGTGNS